MKKGAPISAVILPGGISEGGIIDFERISPIVMKMLPPTIEKGSSLRLSAPTIVLIMWGMTKPIKPITPLQETIVLTIRVHIKRIERLVLSTFTPKLCAV